MFSSWISYEDQVTKKIFWYNQKTHESRWEKPSGASSIERKSTFTPMNHHKSSMKLRKNGDWIEYITEFGKPFYYNEVNGKFQWNDPNKAKTESSTDLDSSPWKAYRDPDSGAVFWYNHETNVSQWNCPFDSSLEDHDDVKEVHDFNDLGI